MRRQGNGGAVGSGPGVGEMEQALRHLERFDPLDAGGKLIDTEHRGRYWWASQVVAGREVLDAACGVGYGVEILATAGALSVTGVDIDGGAVEQARQRFGDSAEELIEGDLRDLPLDDDSFDVAVCFETIEHIEGAERALAELRRVLRPDGLLLVSSPNPDVYPAGNEHHVHEYRPTELAAAVGEHFTRVTSYRQHAWLASAIEAAAEGSGNGAVKWDERSRVARTTALPGGGGETFGIVVAGDGELPVLDDLVSLGSAFEVAWWSEQVANAKEEGNRGADEAGRQSREVENEARKAITAAEDHAREQIEIAKEDARKAIGAAEEDARETIGAAEEDARRTIAVTEENARNAVAIAEERAQQVQNDAGRAVAQADERAAAATERLREASAALLEANQELAQIPVWQHRHAELHSEYAQVHDECAQLRGLVDELQGSKSWRMTSPLRGLWRAFGLRR